MHMSIDLFWMPILVPAITKLGIDPLQFGIVMVVNLTIGGVTPPVTCRAAHRRP